MKRAKGFSLIELLLVLGVLAILLVAAFVVYPQVRNRHQANVETQNLLTIKANFIALYARGGDPTSLTNAIANQARLFPSSMNRGDYSATASITSAWGGTVGVSPNDSTSVNFTYTAVPGGVCLPLLSSAAPHFRSVRVAAMRGTFVQVITNGQLDVAAAAAVCETYSRGARLIFNVDTYDH